MGGPINRNRTFSALCWKSIYDCYAANVSVIRALMPPVARLAAFIALCLLNEGNGRLPAIALAAIPYALSKTLQLVTANWRTRQLPACA